MTRVLLVTAALVAAVLLFVLATLPPAPRSVGVAGVDPRLAQRTVPGAYHIHTTRSDGAEDKAAVAAAARRAGLAFAIFTDHGDGTRAPDPPEYIDDVLCIDGVEISTNGGHYVALDMPASPYPLGGDAAAVVEDVARLGGFGIAAHPDSPKAELAWTDWRAPIDGLEWLNADSEWRDESTTRLIRAVIDYAVRPAPALAALLDRPAATLDRWEELSRRRRVVALAGLDAHGSVKRRLEGGSYVGGGPSYEASFRTLANRVLLERPLSGNATADARAILDAIRQGRVYAAIDALARPAPIDPTASASSWILPAGATVVEHGAAGGVIWREVQLTQAPGAPPVPWIVTNPIRAPQAVPPQMSTVPSGGVPVTPDWRIEKDAVSAGSLAVSPGGRISVEYALRPDARASQFVALAGDLSGGTPAAQVVFEGRAATPMRVSVQLRFPGTERRWGKSVYLDPDSRTVVVPVGEMRAAEGDGASMPDSSTARSLLFVVDLTNAAPGSRGSFSISNVRLAPRQLSRRNVIERRDQVAREQAVAERLAQRALGYLPRHRPLPGAGRLPRGGGDERSQPAAHVHHTLLYQAPVGVLNRVGVYLQIARQPAHRR